MDKMKAKRAVDGLVRLKVLEVICEGEGRSPATYRLSEPVELLCEEPCVSESHEETRHNDTLRLAKTNDNETQFPQPPKPVENSGETRHNADFVSHVHTEKRDTLFTPLRGETTYVSPSLGTKGQICVSDADGLPDPESPRCPKCGSVMQRTNTFLPGGVSRIWRCGVCCEELAVKDEYLSQPDYSPPRPRGTPAGGQDRATRAFE